MKGKLETDVWKIIKIGIIIYIIIILLPPILKLVGVAKISWFVALLPIIIPTGFFILAFIGGMLLSIPEIRKQKVKKK